MPPNLALYVANTGYVPHHRHQHQHLARRSMKHSLKMGRLGHLCALCSPADVFSNGWNTPSDIFGRMQRNDRLPVPNATSVSRRAITSISICERTKGRHLVVVERVVGLERLEIGSMGGGGGGWSRRQQ